MTTAHCVAVKQTKLHKSSCCIILHTCFVPKTFPLAVALIAQSSLTGTEIIYKTLLRIDYSSIFSCEFDIVSIDMCCG
jgi:hypothetical protein